MIPELIELRPDEHAVVDAAEALLKTKFSNAGYIIFVHTADEPPDRCRMITHGPGKRAILEMVDILYANLVRTLPGAVPTEHPNN